ncbi:MAG: DsbA family protein [Myxococcota bacterium]
MARPKKYGVGALVAAGAAALVVGFVVGRASAPKEGASPEKVAPAEGSAASGGYEEEALDLPPSPDKGPDDAPVVIYEFSDFQCPFCSKVTGTVDEIARTWPEDVRIVFKHNPLSFHDDARLAAIASMAAAEQGHFWKYHDLLFANQKALKRDDLIGYAEDLGLDMEKFEADLDDAMIARKVDMDQAAAMAVGATGTPAFFVNGVSLSGAKPLSEFEAEIEKQLESAKELAEGGVAREKISRRLTAQAGGSATKFIKYVVDGNPAPKPKQKKKPEKKKEDTETVWKVAVDPETEHIKGPKYAPVTIVEFSDFECPFCSKVMPTYEKIREEYGDDVRVVFKHNPLPFHEHAPLASQAALAAGAQGKFWEMHDVLFDNQKNLTRPDLESYAEELGLDMEEFRKALDEGTYAKKIEEDQALAERVKAKGTPNHYINGRRLNGAKPFDAFATIIDEELKHAEKLREEGVSEEDLYPKLIAGGKEFNPLDSRVRDIAAPADAPSKGPANAPITIIEFSDFECPFCSRVGDPLKKLQARYPEQVRIVFKHFPLNFHDNAQKAAEASMAAHAQDRFWDMHDIMFQNQKSLGVPQLKVYAKQLGLDVEKFEQALDSDEYADEVKADVAEGRRVGVRGTPSVYINGRKYSPSGGYSAESIEKVLAREFDLDRE